MICRSGSRGHTCILWEKCINMGLPMNDRLWKPIRKNLANKFEASFHLWQTETTQSNGVTDVMHALTLHHITLSWQCGGHIALPASKELMWSIALHQFRDLMWWKITWEHFQYYWCALPKTEHIAFSMWCIGINLVYIAKTMQYWYMVIYHITLYCFTIAISSNVKLKWVIKP
jgi:hypothetical protein